MNDIYKEKQMLFKRKILQLLTKIKEQEEIRKYELNIFTFDDDGNIKRVSVIPGINFIKKPGFTNVFITHASNRFAASTCVCITYDNFGFIDKTPHLVNQVRIDFGSKSELYIDKGFSCGGLDIRLREHHNVYIGEDCMFSSNISIWTSDGHAIFDKTGNLINIGGDVVIGDHVWVGHGVKFLKKSFVNDGSVVGGSSLVTKQFNESNIIIAGFPAKKIREEINWTRKPVFTFTDQ